MRVHLEGTEVGDGPPVLILHGLFGSGGNWRSIATKLAHTYRVLCVDLRNHGASPWTESMDYLRMADDVRAFIESKALGRVSLIGHSMGGKTAMAMALLYPDLVDKLIVVDIAPIEYSDRLSVYVEAMRGIDMFNAGSRSEVQRRLSDAVADDGVAAFLMQNLAARNDHFDWRLNLLAIGASMPKLVSFPKELRGLRWRRPLTAIIGAESDYVSPASDELFRPMFKQVRIEVIEGAGHWLHAEKPSEFLVALQRALVTPTTSTADAA